MRKLLKNRGLISIEASLVLTIFIMGYILLNYILISVYVESSTKKIINAIADDFAHFTILVNKTELSDYLVKEDNIDLIEVASRIISDNITLESDDFGYKKIVEGMKTLANNKATHIGRDLLFNSILRNIFLSKASQLDFNYFNMIENGVGGLDFNDSIIIPKDNIINLSLNYKLEINSFNIFGLNREIKQNAYIGSKIYKLSKNENNSDDGNKDGQSIWHDTNFERGKYFSSLIRKDSPIHVLKTGRGLDLYESTTNTFYQLHSINVFTGYYSNKQGQVHSINYLNLSNHIKKLNNELKRNIQNIGTSIELEDGSIKTILANPKGSLILIFPEEAKNMTDLSKLLDDLRLEGINLDVKYMEKAL